MSTDNTTIRDIMLPLSGFPSLAQTATVEEAIRQLHSFCPVGASGPCGFNELMVVDDRGGLVGRITPQGVLRVLFSTLLESVDVKRFEGVKVEYSDLTTLLNGVILREGSNHLQAPLSSVIERPAKILAPDDSLLHAMSCMVILKETSLPVAEGGKLVGVVQLTEIFSRIGDLLFTMNTN